MLHRHRFEPLLLVIMAACAGIALAVEDRVVAAAFSAAQPGTALPAGWAPLAVAGIKNRTQYTVVDDGGTTVVRAESRAAASGLSRPLRVNPAEFPWLRWRWKIDRLIANADIQTREGDDFPARMYVMFDYPLEKLPFVERNKLRLARALFDPDLPAATLCYVWEGKAAVETIVPSAYSDRVRLIVAASGAARLGRWVDFERNVAADFHAAFGETAPPIRAIAIATDTDNTGAYATAYYGDISFYKQRVMNIPLDKATTP
ncbi:MAG: DUF3047 domain-containing protein [Burkholderiales bacterium]|jgi:hypothetical protein|nr:DUF3047 domain-containing protein [Burkholderiales bacterium]